MLERWCKVTFFNTHTCLTTGEHTTSVWRFCVEVVITVCLVIPFRSWIAVRNTVLQTFPQIIVTWHQVVWMSRLQRMSDYSVPRKCFVRHLLNYWLYGWLQHLPGRIHIPFHHYLISWRMVWESVHCIFLNCLCWDSIQLFSLHWQHAILQLNVMYWYVVQ